MVVLTSYVDKVALFRVYSGLIPEFDLFRAGRGAVYRAPRRNSPGHKGPGRPWPRLFRPMPPGFYLNTPLYFIILYLIVLGYVYLVSRRLIFKENGSCVR